MSLLILEEVQGISLDSNDQSESFMKIAQNTLLLEMCSDVLADISGLSMLCVTRIKSDIHYALKCVVVLLIWFYILDTVLPRKLTIKLMS